MKNAKQIVFILIGVAMILLSVGLIFMKRSVDNDELRQGDSGTRIFEGPVNTLVFEAGASEIDIVEGTTDEYILAYEGLSHATISDRLENGELTITLKMDSDWTSKLFKNNIEDAKITLTIPKGTMFESALFEFGAADVEMNGVAAEKLYITVGAGALSADGLIASELAKLNVGAGAFYADEAALTNAVLECGVGEMNVSGAFNGDTSADCGIGSMELVVYGDQEEYHGELNCGLGEIDFGDISIEGSGNKTYGTSSAECRMDIKCGIGEVDVRFYN